MDWTPRPAGTEELAHVEPGMIDASPSSRTRAQLTQPQVTQPQDIADPEGLTLRIADRSGDSPPNLLSSHFPLAAASSTRPT